MTLLGASRCGAVLLLATVSVPPVTAREGRAATLTRVSEDVQSTPASSIPADVSYAVIERHIVPGIKRELQVRINKIVPEHVVRAIALRLKAEETTHFDRTLIAILLPNMKPGAGAWATAFFDPDLEIRILGVSVEEAKQLDGLRNRPVSPGRQVIGAWIDDGPGGFKSRIVIVQKGGRLFSEETFSDGSGPLVGELLEKPSPRGRKFIHPKRTQVTGDHWLIDASGNLEMRDNDGLISTARIHK